MNVPMGHMNATPLPIVSTLQARITAHATSQDTVTMAACVQVWFK